MYGAVKQRAPLAELYCTEEIKYYNKRYKMYNIDAEIVPYNN